jgi:PIN domain nuclease of toxin-antitoxin system
MAVLLDTHAWVWTNLDSRPLSAPIRTLLADARPALLSAVSIYEVAHKARLGKWPGVLPVLDGLNEDVRLQGVQVADVDGPIALLAAQLDWAHRDPFDRLIAATAILSRATLISADAQFDDLKSRPDWPGRLW